MELTILEGMDEVGQRFGMGHRILVTGGAGFVGSHVVDVLLDRGVTVVAVDNFVTGSKENVAHLDDHPRFTLVEADVSEGLPADAGPLAERFDAIMHLASPASPTDFPSWPSRSSGSTRSATLHLLDRRSSDGARFLMASTSEAYGDPLVHPQPETYWGNVNPIGVRSVYDESKRFAEAATMAYHRYRGLDVGIVRIFNTYGPRMRPDDGRAIPTFITQALRGEPLTVHGAGDQTRSICLRRRPGPRHCRCCSTRPRPGRSTAAPSTSSPCGSWPRRSSGWPAVRSKIVYLPRTPDDPERRRPDLTLARTLLGYEPLVDPEEGLRRTIAYFAERLGR